MKQRQYGIFETVDVDDPKAVSDWAAGMCRGLTVEEAASLFGSDPDRASVVDNVARTVPLKLRQIAAEACDAELRKTEERSDKESGT